MWDGNRPIFGMVYDPSGGWIWWGALHNREEKAAYRTTLNTEGAFQGKEKIQAKVFDEQDAEYFPVSNSHANLATVAYMCKFYPKMTTIERCGSSIKLMRVAEGKAYVYVRLSGICEWDIAASVAILEAAGGHCIQLETFGHTGKGWKSHTDAMKDPSKDYLQDAQSHRPTLVPKESVNPGKPVPFNQEVMQSIMSFKAVGNISGSHSWNVEWMDKVTTQWPTMADFKNWLNKPKDQDGCQLDQAVIDKVKEAGPDGL